MARRTVTRTSRTFVPITKSGPEGSLLRFFIPNVRYYKGRERPKDIRPANRSSSTEVEHCQCNSHREAGETNIACDDKDEPLQERSGGWSHLIQPARVLLSNAFLQLIIFWSGKIATSKVSNTILLPRYLRRAEATNPAFRGRA